MAEVYHLLGLMSGTSLDGLDMALCRFVYNGSKWQYETLQCETAPYPSELIDRLAAAYSGTAYDLAVADQRLGQFMADQVNAFLAHAVLRPDYIASHGHTIFHRPDQGITTQIGSGAVLAAQTGIPVICDFRSADVALGGQGAPLVPVGDELLFADYDACLNLGGFSNISFRQRGHRVAFDISPCNMALNDLARQLGQPFDKDGVMAAQGAVVPALLEQLNALPFYAVQGSKSLGREWYEQTFQPLVAACDASVHDKLRTVTEHIAMQLAAVINQVQGDKVLVTGGGAKNSFLLQRVRAHSAHQLIVPDAMTVDYKEALIFAFLGVLRLRGEANCLADVTGAPKDHCSGAIYGV